MSQPKNLTLGSIKQRYHDEWLLTAYTDIDENRNVLCGEVLAQAKDANKRYELLPQYPDRSMAFEYAGEILANFAFMLRNVILFKKLKIYLFQPVDIFIRHIHTMC